MNCTREYVLGQIDKEIGNIRKSENIEKSVYNYTIEYSEKKMIECSWGTPLFAHVYKQKATNILYSLKNIQNFKENVLSNEIASREVAYVKHCDMNVRDEQDVQPDDVADGIFKCTKCGSKKTTYYSLQTRSADEPMTNFITCIVCKNRWKM